MHAGVPIGRTQSEPNVVPLIDIMLVLLIVFMLTSAMQRQVLEAHLPSSARGGPPAEVRQILLDVGPGRAYSVDGHPVPRDELQARLRALRDRMPGATLMVRGDGRASYQDVISAIDAAKGAGVSVVGLWTRRD